MSGDPTVSVIIPHYGEAGPTLELVSAMQRQIPEPHQVIVADDCSPDPFPRISSATVIRRESNGGFGSAVNSGAAAATGEWLLVLNSDVEVADDFLGRLVRAATPWMPAVVSPRVIGRDGNPAWTARHFPTTSHMVVEWLTPLARWRGTRILHEAVGHDTAAADRESASVVDWVVGAAMLLPTRHFRDVGGFDERFHMNSEELDLQRRLRELGVPSVLLTDPVLTHHGGGSSHSDERRDWLLTSRLAYADKWGSDVPLRAGLSAAVTVNLLWGGIRHAAGRPTTPLRDAKRDWAVIWRGR